MFGQTVVSCEKLEDWPAQQGISGGHKRAKKDTGQDTGHRTQDTGHRTQDTGHWTQDTGHRTLDTGHRTQEALITVQGGGEGGSLG